LISTQHIPASIFKLRGRWLIGVFALFLMSFCLPAFATHNRAGEITYTHLYGNTYEVVLITYTYSKSLANHNRDELTLEWGDGTYSQIPRISKTELPDEYQKNVYRAQHTYPGAGRYEISMLDYNRNEGIDNIFDSVNIPFAISTTLHINPVIGDNSTPQLLNPPFDKAAKGAVFIHNPAAHDPDGDSLSYALAVCKGEDGKPIEGYTYPPASTGFYINEQTGDLVWDAPTKVGKYNVALVVKEWRDGQKIGEIVRDIQIEVIESENKIPEVPELPDWCVYEGDTVSFEVTASDPDGDLVKLEAVGGPFLLADNQADFPTVEGDSSVTSRFEWITSCQDVRVQPYLVVFKASNHFENVTLADMSEVEIRVLPHPPVFDSAVPSFNSVSLYWQSKQCDNLTGYEIYRSQKPEIIPVGECLTGMPENTSYEKVAEVSAAASHFEDINDGQYLQSGKTYCYRIVAVYNGGYQSFPSNEICVNVKKGLPKFTKVSVDETSNTSGRIKLEWTKARMDSDVFPGPYKYIVKRSEVDVLENYREIFTSTSISDTSFIDRSVDTETEQWKYKIETYYTLNGEMVLLGASATASSMFLRLLPYDYALEASVSESVPWKNISYIMYDVDNDSIAGFDKLPSKITGLNNGQEYCMTVKATGKYSALDDELINYSQRACGVPMDTVPPVPMEFDLYQSCDSLQNVLSWNLFGATDVDRIEVYHSECETGNYELVADLPGAVESFSHDFTGSPRSMSGCYKVIVADAAGNKSEPFGPKCVYACEEYKLPNVFTPNNDGSNDLFVPISGARHIERIDMEIFSSWGTSVYKTTDPQIKWNGISYENWEPVPDGVYYFVCDIYEKWHSCEVGARTIFGFIQVFTGQDPDKKVIINE